MYVVARGRISQAALLQERQLGRVHSRSISVCDVELPLLEFAVANSPQPIANKELRLMSMQDQNKAKKIKIKIDGEEYEVEDRGYTLRELLELSGNNPETTYLVERHGHDETEYTDLDAVVKLRKNIRFITGDRGAAPVA